MKSNSVLWNVRSPELTKEAFCFFYSKRWMEGAQPPEKCKFCNSKMTVRRGKIFECLDCDSFLGKAQS